MEIIMQPSDRNDWEDDVRNFMSNHATHQDTSKKWSCEIQILERLNTSLLTLINNWTQEFINLCQADQLDLVHLTERHHEDTNNSSAVFLNKLEFCTRTWPSELHTVLKSFQEQEKNTDHELKIDLQTSSIPGRPKIEKLLDQWITHILSGLYHDILHNLVTNVRNILQRKHQTCTNVRNILRRKHQTFQIRDTNTCNTRQKNLRKMSEWGNEFQQVGASTSDTQNLAKTRQTALQAFLLAFNRQKRDCFYSKRRRVLKMKSGRIITDLQWSSVYHIHGYMDQGMFDKTLLSTMHRNGFPVCSLELGWSGQILEPNYSTEIYLMRPKIFWINYFGHIPAPTLTITKCEKCCTFFDASLHGRSKALCGEFKLDVNQKTAKLNTCPSDFCEDIKIKLELISLNQGDILDLERSIDEKVKICLSYVQTVEEKVQKLHQHDVFKKHIYQMKERMDHMEKSMNRVGKCISKKSSQSKLKLHFTTTMCIEAAELPIFILAQKRHGEEPPELGYVKLYFCNTNLSSVLCPAQLCLYNGQPIIYVLYKSISKCLQLQELHLDLDDYKLDLLRISCLSKLYLYIETIFTEGAIPKGESWLQFIKHQAFKQPHHDLGDGKQYLARASYPCERYLIYVTLAFMSTCYSLSLCTELNALKRSQAYIGHGKQDISGLFCWTELYSESLVPQSNCRSNTLNEYSKECWIQYCKKLKKIKLSHFQNVIGNIGLPSTYYLQNLSLNEMTLYAVYNCLSQRANLKEPTPSCVNICDGKLEVSMTSLLSVCQTYSTILLERIRGAERKGNRSSMCARMQWCSDFYFNHADGPVNLTNGMAEEEQFDSAGLADNGHNIHVADAYVPNFKPANSENEMIQMIDHRVLIHGGSSKSNPSPIVIKRQLATEKACYHTPIRVTDVPSDYISLTRGKRPEYVSFRVKDDLLEHLSPISKMTKEQDLVKFREKMKLQSSRRKSDICSLVKGFFTILGTILHGRSNGNKTSLYILSEPDLEISSHKEMFEAGTNERNVNDIDLQDKKKHYLQRLTRIPFEYLPQPILKRDEIVCFVEGQTHHTVGGSSVSPFEHGDLREMLNQLASDNVPAPQITMKYEMLRLCTMKSFPEGDHPFAIRIVGAGFYYAGNRDQVVCYCCGSRKDNWVLGDIPLFIHQTMFPSCSFLTSNATVNVPIIKTNSARSSADVHLIGVQRSNGSNQLDTGEGESPLMLLSSEKQQENISSRNHQMLVTNKGSPTHQLMSSGGKNVLDCGQTTAVHMYSMEDPPPMYPQYSSKNMRINSFQGWPVELRHRPEEMAECGFYYAGFGDSVRCFWCGVGLRQWINEDDPWIEHARWSTSCIYVLKRKGEEFVSLVKMAVELAEREEASQNNGGVNQPHQDNTETALENTVKEDYHNSNSANSTAPKDVTSSTGTTGGAVGGVETPISSPGNAEIQKYLLTDAARSVLDMGYEPKLVLRAIDMVLMKKGSVELTGQVIMEAVFEIEEDTGNSKLPQTSQSEQENKRNTKDSAAAERAITGALAINPEQIVREHTELLDATLCKICLNKTMSIVFLPCGHLVTCPDCAPAMRKCPVCRSLIKGTVKTLFG